MKRRFLAMSMAAVTALTSTSICAFADGQNSEALASAITIAKTRLDIPEELTEFSYDTSDRYNTTVYYLTWKTPRDADEYKYASVTVCGSLILGYFSSDSYKYDEKSEHFAKLSGDELYKKAQAAVKKLDPTVADVISIDRDSLDISVYGKGARFSLVRTKNGVPVSNDNGSISLDKDTGELVDFNLNWHANAAFRDSKSAISLDKAKKKYAEMIQLTPQYEFNYDWETKKLTAQLVYRQNDFGEINAFTGKKSDFSADGYYDDSSNDMTEEDTAADMDTGKGGDGGYQFTEAEQAELDRKLPYASSEAVIKLMQSDKYMSYSTDMELVSSQLYKFRYTNGDKYYYTASFSNVVPDENDYTIEEIVEADGSVSVPAVEEPADWQEVNITVDAESGQVISYYLFDSNDSDSKSYDQAKADKLAEEIARTYAADHFAEYKGSPSSVYTWTESRTNTTYYGGSSHRWDRYSNDILVSGDSISVGFNSSMKLTSYSYSYTDIKLPDPSRMLSTDMVMQKFWEKNDLNLYYLARFTDKKTKTVLVYGTDSYVYVDATTGEPVYSWRYEREKNDLSGIKDKKILKMAKALDDHGYIISTKKFSEKDVADSEAFEQLMGVSTGENSKKLTRGDALVIFTKSVAGDKLPELKGIYKSPFSDVKDTDKNVGYYAIAYAMGVVSGDKLNAKSDFTYGDMIKMVYTLYTTDTAV